MVWTPSDAIRHGLEVLGGPVRTPFNLGIAEAGRPIIPIRLNGHGTYAGTQVDRHEGVAGFVIGVDFGHALRYDP